MNDFDWAELGDYFEIWFEQGALLPYEWEEIDRLFVEYIET